MASAVPRGDTRGQTITRRRCRGICSGRHGLGLHCHRPRGGSPSCRAARRDAAGDARCVCCRRVGAAWRAAQVLPKLWRRLPKQTLGRRRCGRRMQRWRQPAASVASCAACRVRMRNRLELRLVPLPALTSSLQLYLLPAPHCSQAHSHVHALTPLAHQLPWCCLCRVCLNLLPSVVHPLCKVTERS